MEPGTFATGEALRRERDARIVERIEAGETLRAVGRSLGITSERVRQIFVKETGHGIRKSLLTPLHAQVLAAMRLNGMWSGACQPHKGRNCRTYQDLYRSLKGQGVRFSARHEGGQLVLTARPERGENSA